MLWSEAGLGWTGAAGNQKEAETSSRTTADPLGESSVGDKNCHWTWSGVVSGSVGLLVYLLPSFGLRRPWKTLREVWKVYVWYLISVVKLLLARLQALGGSNQILTDLSTERSVCQVGTIWEPNKHMRSRAHKHKAFIHRLSVLRITLLIFSLNLNPCLVALRHPKLSASHLWSALWPSGSVSLKRFFGWMQLRVSEG